MCRPYTPANKYSVALMPILHRAWGKYAQAGASGIALAVFIASELMLEKLVIVTGTVMTKLESWQMYMCYVPAEWFETRTWSPIDVLIGEYSPTFKIHFYAIAVALILTLLNSFYGFGRICQGEGRERLRALILQSVSTGLFLGLCILACFTAFWRTGELLVSPLSASLMCLFFMTFGVTMGIFTGSLLLRFSRAVCLGIAGGVASATALLMYIGELCLLHGHLYRFGTSFPFKGMGVLVLAPIDLLVILASGVLTWLILRAEYRRENI